MARMTNPEQGENSQGTAINTGTGTTGGWGAGSGGGYVAGGGGYQTPDPTGAGQQGAGNWWGTGGDVNTPNRPGMDDPYWSNYFRDNFGHLAPVPQLGSLNQDQDRLNQMSIIQNLQRQAQGDWNSTAQRGLQQQSMQAQQQQDALAASQRGVGAGAQMAQGQRYAQDVQRALPGQQKMLYLQEQQAAQQALAQQLAVLHGQDINQANNAANIGLQGNALNDAWQQFLAGQGSQGVIDRGQNQLDAAAASLGFGLDDLNIQRQNTQNVLNTIGTLSSMYSQMNNQQGGKSAAPAASTSNPLNNASATDYLSSAGGYS